MRAVLISAADIISGTLEFGAISIQIDALPSFRPSLEAIRHGFLQNQEKDSPATRAAVRLLEAFVEYQDFRDTLTAEKPATKTTDGPNTMDELLARLQPKGEAS